MITRYVNTSSTAGGDGTTNNTTGATRAFATLKEALDSLPATLTDATTIYCDGTGGVKDTTAVDQTPWDMVTSAANYLLVTTDANNRAQMPIDFNRYVLEVTNANGLYNNIPSHIRFDGLQVHLIGNDGTSYVGIKTSNANETAGDIDTRISNCVVKATMTNGTGSTGYNPRPPGGGGAGTTKVWNCVAYDCGTGFASDWASTDFANCTAYNCEFAGFSDGSSITTWKNCLGAGTFNGSDFSGASAADSNFNASSDGSAPGANSRINQTFTFHNTSSRNLHLGNGDGGAKDFGTSDPFSGLYSDDIDGQTRSGSWDIGADETGAASAAVTGTATAAIKETDVRTGGKTVIVTLTNSFLLPSTGVPIFVDAETATTTAAPGANGNATITGAFPAGYSVVPGDFALWVAYLDAGTLGTPSGWANITGSPFGSGPRLYIFTRTLVSGDSAPSASVSGAAAGDSSTASMIVFNGIGSVGAIGTATAGTGTPMTAAAITTTANNSIVLGVAGRGDNENSSGQTFGASATGVREILDAGTNVGNDSQTSCAMKSFPTSGTSSGSFSATTSITDPFVCVQVELLPSTPFTDARSAIATNLYSAQSEAAGWDAKVKVNIPVANVVRTSANVYTVTLQAQSDYDITAQETITATVPAAAVYNNTAITGSPTFTVDAVASGWSELGRSFHPGRTVNAMARFLATYQGHTRPISGVVFRKTLSRIGTKTGSRQTHNE